MSALYEADVFAWSEQQAGLLRRLAAGERLNEPPDWNNIVEELESVGREQLHAVESLLVQALAHMLKAKAWPASRFAPGWKSEARRLRGDAAARFTPSMRQKLDVARIYRRALAAVPDAIDGQPGLPVPPACLMTLDELLGEGDLT